MVIYEDKVFMGLILISMIAVTIAAIGCGIYAFITVIEHSIFEAGLITLMFGIIGWVVNKLMACSSWHIGYFFVVTQGVGIGLIIASLAGH